MQFANTAGFARSGLCALSGHKWGKIEAPHSAFYGMVAGTEVATWWKQFGELLFVKNLRSTLGHTEVNRQILATIEDRPDDFWYFNNGITITAKSVEKTAAGAGNRELGNFKAVGAHVVNGAQTVSSVGRFSGDVTRLEKVKIPLRIISLQEAANEYEALITRSNNTQNRIEARDFVSQDKEQQRLRLELQMSRRERHHGGRHLHDDFPEVRRLQRPGPAGSGRPGPVEDFPEKSCPACLNMCHGGAFASLTLIAAMSPRWNDAFSPAHLPPAWSRREWLRVGGLGALGLGLPALLQAKPKATGVSQGVSFGRAKSCIILFLSGGPPQHETFDPKPDAPVDIRGNFRPISTTVPGMQFCETLPCTARIAHHLAVIRSMFTDIHSHSTSGACMLTGYEPASKAENVPPGLEDWPSIAAVAGALKPSTRSPLSSVVLPDELYNDGHIVWPGQNGGFMGSKWHPTLMKCDPTQLPMHIEGMTLDEHMSSLRLGERFDLMRQLDQHFNKTIQSSAISEMSEMHQKAFDLLHSESSRAAFALEQESPALREAYGPHKFGQSVLLARRLVESGSRLVQVNWPREGEKEVKGSPLWDTHADNAGRVRNVLCPQFDRTFATLIDDLHQRGLLEKTLVVVMGEFGRSPKVNAVGGRDHWGSVFSVVLAGAGIGGGQIIGASDHIGALPQSRPVRPSDLAATIFHLLGIDPAGDFPDALNRPRLITNGGSVLRELAAV